MTRFFATVAARKDDDRAAGPSTGLRRLAVFFAIAYLAQGTSQQWGLVGQPLEYFLMRSQGLDAAAVARVMALLMVPWMIKPLYGVLSDFLPLFGYRRKGYLFVSQTAAGLAFLLIALYFPCGALVPLLAVAALGMAMATTLTVALSVEAGDGGRETRRLQGVQAVSYCAANIAAVLAGGFLANSLPPAEALRLAAFAAAVLPLVVSGAGALVLVEPRVSLSVQGAGRAASALRQALCGRPFWLAAAFMCLWNFSPGFGVPLYFYESTKLNFTQLLIGQLAAVNGLGMIAGALFFTVFMAKRLSGRAQIGTSIALSTASTAAFFWLGAPGPAFVLEFCRGFAAIVGMLSLYGLAADVCPKGGEATATALLIAMYNIAGQAGTVTGGYLYSKVLDESFATLALISAAATASTALLWPFLAREGNPCPRALP